MYKHSNARIVTLHRDNCYAIVSNLTGLVIAVINGTAKDNVEKLSAELLKD